MMIEYAAIKDNWVREHDTFLSFQDLEIGMTEESLSVRNAPW